MRLVSLTESGAISLLWIFLSFILLDEEPVFDFSDWNLTQIILLALGLMAVVWENLLRVRAGAYVYKDLVLTYATFFFIFSLERYMQLIQVIFFCHCLSPLEIDLMDSTEVFLEYFGVASFYLVRVTFLIVFLWTLATIGSKSLIVGRGVAYQFLATFICLSIVITWLVVGWDLSINSLSLLDVGAGSELLYPHSPSSMTYNSISNNGDQFDWHKEQIRPFMVRFEVLYLFAMQLFLFITLGLNAWIWGLLVIDALSSQARAVTFWGLGLRALGHTVATNIISFVLLGLPYLRALTHVPYEFMFLG
jgi:hypothetical protein